MIITSLNSLEFTEECIELMDCWFCQEPVSKLLSVFPLNLYQQKKTNRVRCDYGTDGGKILLNLFFKGQYAFELMNITYITDYSLVPKMRGKWPDRELLNYSYPEKVRNSFHFQSDCGFDHETEFHENLKGMSWESAFIRQLEFLDTKMILDPHFSPFSLEDEYKNRDERYRSYERSNFCGKYWTSDAIFLNRKKKMALTMYEDDVSESVGLYLYTTTEMKEIDELKSMDYSDRIALWGS